MLQLNVSEYLLQKKYIYVRCTHLNICTDLQVKNVLKSEIFKYYVYLKDEVVVVGLLFYSVFTELMVKDVDVYVCDEEGDEESKSSVIWLFVDKSLKFGSFGFISLIKIISSSESLEISLDAMMKAQLQQQQEVKFPSKSCHRSELIFFPVKTS